MFFLLLVFKNQTKMSLRCKNKKRVHYEAKRKMTILSFFTRNIPIWWLWTNFYHKEDHFLKFRPLLHYFLEIYLKIYDFTLLKKIFFCPLKKSMSLYNCRIRQWKSECSLDFCLLKSSPSVCFPRTLKLTRKTLEPH